MSDLILPLLVGSQVKAHGGARLLLKSLTSNTASTE